VFPDHAPGRFSLALRAGTARKLEERIAAARHGDDDTPAAAARRVLELLAALGGHDRLTRGHCERVRALNDLLAAEMGLAPEDRDRLRWAALLHDIGKLHVPRRILTKPSKPTNAEWEQLRRHPIDGARLTAGLRPWLGRWADSIPQHHERWDGAGYPNGLAADDICLGARIVAVADTFEVMTARRPYQRPVSPDAARKELARCAGAQFDPAVVRAFLNVSIGDLHHALGFVSWLAELPFLASAPHLEGVAAAAGRTMATLGVSTALTAALAPPAPTPSVAAASGSRAPASAAAVAPLAPAPPPPPSPAPGAAAGGGTDITTEAAPPPSGPPAPPAPSLATPAPAPPSPVGAASLPVVTTVPLVPGVPGLSVPNVAGPTTVSPPLGPSPALPVPALPVPVVPAPPPATPPSPAPPPPPPAPATPQNGGGLLSGLLGTVRRLIG